MGKLITATKDKLLVDRGLLSAAAAGDFISWLSLGVHVVCPQFFHHFFAASYQSFLGGVEH